MRSDRPTIYIAGPMRGRKFFNYPAFDAAEAKLRAAGFDVVNPAQLDRDTGFDPYKLVVPEDFDWMTIPEGIDHITIRECMSRDTKAICERCQGMHMLDGWKNSRGANAEFALANALGLFFVSDTP